jgi:N-acyl-D-aspartate/D-glutamate deacylase
MTSAELLIRGAHVVDGTGMPGFSADVEVRDGRISQIGNLRGATADKVIDADGLVLTPGFVDVHTHYDPQLHFESSASPETAASPCRRPNRQTSSGWSSCWPRSKGCRPRR